MGFGLWWGVGWGGGEKGGGIALLEHEMMNFFLFSRFFSVEVLNYIKMECLMR